MCGINGFSFRNEKLLKAMNKKINYRGPDGKGDFYGLNVSLGHLRLSIIDLSKNGHQPMFYKKNRRELTIIYNGEIYNFKQVKEELINLGYDFESNSDTEVILASYIEWGENCVQKFNGMWAFCIYDKTNEEFFLSRDRFGKKPLYYYNKDSKFIFSSEIKAILEHDIKKEINKESLEEFFTYRFTFDEKTILKDIFNFKPGHNMIYSTKDKRIKSYKQFYNVNMLGVSKKKTSFAQAKKDVVKILEKSVKRRLVSDVPVACLLSGGIDSSIVTYLASKHTKNLNTFSIGFDKTNELPYAKKVSKAFNTIHHEFKINKDDVDDYIEDMVYHMDEPIGADPGFLPIFILSKEVSKYNKVVLSGDGADEIFTGYDRYKGFYYGRLLSNFIPHDFNNEVVKRIKSMRGKDNFKSYIEMTRVFEPKELEELGIKERVDKKVWNSILSTSLDKAQVFDIKTLLPKDFFMKADKMSSAFGLEQRIPFMDYKVVEYVMSLPLKYRLKLWNEKHILKESFKDILPKEITKRRKHGFNVPIDYWFENTLGEKLKDLLLKNNHGLYEKNYIYSLLDKLKDTKGGFKSRNVVAQKLWTVLVFEIWYDLYIKK